MKVLDCVMNEVCAWLYRRIVANPMELMSCEPYHLLYSLIRES